MERTPLDEKRQRSASRFERVEGETAPTSSMRPSTKAPLLAPLARRRTQLIEKGVPNMPKGGHASDLARLAKSDSLNICGPRTQWKRKEGEFGSGPYSEEPWSLQAMEKRVYALRDFYKRELEGSSIDDPA